MVDRKLPSTRMPAMACRIAAANSSRSPSVLPRFDFTLEVFF
jgi:hypothetical protein